MIFVLALIVAVAQAVQHHTHSAHPHPTHDPSHTILPHHTHSAHPHPTHDPSHTNLPHHTHSHEHNEHGLSTFYFDANTHIMVMKIETQCYLMKLDDAEAMKVHDAAGIVEIELSMVKMIGAANETMVSHHNLAMMSAHVAHMCPNGAMQLERS